MQDPPHVGNNERVEKEGIVQHLVLKRVEFIKEWFSGRDAVLLSLVSGRLPYENGRVANRQVSTLREFD